MRDFLYNEWKRKSKELTERMQEYEVEYRRKKTEGKELHQLENEGWRVVYGELYCDNLHKARNQKFKKEIEEEMWFKFVIHLLDTSDNPSKVLQETEGYPSSTLFVQHIFQKNQS